MCYERLFFIPLAAALISIICIPIIFQVSIDRNLVYSVLPSIGDILPLEKIGHVYRSLSLPSYLFQWYLFIISMLGFTIIYIRHRQIKYVFKFYELKENKIVSLALLIGVTMAILLMILPYCIDYFVCQYMGVLACMLICIYEGIDIYASILIYKEVMKSVEQYTIIVCKTVVAATSLLMLAASKVFWEVAIRRFAPGKEGSNYTYYQKKDWGYEAHLVYAICEWVFTGLTFVYFFLLFAFDFCFVHSAEPEVDVNCEVC